MKKMKNILNSTSNKKKTQGRFKAIIYHGSTILIKCGTIVSAFALSITGPLRENMGCCSERHRDSFAQLHLHELSFTQNSEFIVVFNMVTPNI